jgi:hypothetical protein
VISQMVAYFGDLEQCMLECSAVSGYVVLRYEVTALDGKMRLRAQLQDGGELELFEYIALNAQEQITRLKYSSHWQNADGLLVRRWDAVRHYPELPYAPHHVHFPDGRIEGVTPAPDITTVLTEIEENLKKETHTDA